MPGAGTAGAWPRRLPGPRRGGAHDGFREVRFAAVQGHQRSQGAGRIRNRQGAPEAFIMSEAWIRIGSPWCGSPANDSRMPLAVWACATARSVGDAGVEPAGNMASAPARLPQPIIATAAAGPDGSHPRPAQPGVHVGAAGQHAPLRPDGSSDVHPEPEVGRIRAHQQPVDDPVRQNPGPPWPKLPGRGGPQWPTHRRPPGGPRRRAGRPGPDGVPVPCLRLFRARRQRGGQPARCVPARGRSRRGDGPPQRSSPRVRAAAHGPEEWA